MTVKFIALYPQPTDAAVFNAEYEKHLKLMHEKTGMPADFKPYSVIRLVPGPDGVAPYYLMFVMPFPSMEEMQAALASPAMQEISADAMRLSTGGAPVMLFGEDI